MTYPNISKDYEKPSQEYCLWINSSSMTNQELQNYFWNNHRKPWALNLIDSKTRTRKTPRWSGASWTTEILSTKQEIISAPSPSNLEEDLGMPASSPRQGCYWEKRIHTKEVPPRPLLDSSGDSSLLHLQWNIVHRRMEVKFWFSHQPVLSSIAIEPCKAGESGIAL